MKIASSRSARLLLQLMGEQTPPRSLAHALALGAVIGVMPLAWGTSLLCMGAAVALRLNPVAAQIGNFAVLPLHIALFAPYFYFGTVLFGRIAPADGAGHAAICLGDGPLQMLRFLAGVNGRALLVWGVTSPLLGMAFYFVAEVAIRRIRGRYP